MGRVALAGTMELRLDGPGLRSEVFGVGCEQRSRPGIAEACASVLPERLEKLVAGRTACPWTDSQHGALGESGEKVESIASWCQCLCRAQVEGAGEHRQRSEQRPLVGLQHVVRPADGVVHCAVPRIALPAHRLEDAEALVEAVGDFGHADRARPGRSQLDGQRDPVQPPADLDDQRPSRLVEHEGGVGRFGASDEEGDRGNLRQLAERQLRADQFRGSGRQRVHRPEPLAGYRQRFPTGCHDRDGGCLTQDSGHQLGHRLDQVLAVVENQQAVPGAEQIDDGIVDRARLPQVDVDGRGERRCRGIRIDNADQLHDVDAALEFTTDRAGQLHGQRGLPDTTGTHQCDQPVVADHLGQLSQQHLAADQRLHTAH